MAAKVFLRISRDGKLESEKELTGRKTILGRGEGGADNRIVLNDETVSFDHAQIQLRGEDVLIQDLKSRNKVLVNGQFINPGVFYRLRQGDVIEICAYSMKVDIRTPRTAPPLEKAPPELGGISLAVYSSPASAAAHDFVSFQSLKDGRAGIAVGTIGMDSEIGEETATGCGELLRIAAAASESPSEVIAGLSRALAGDPVTRNPVGIAYGILDPKQLSFRFASAGGISAAFYSKAKPAGLRHIASDCGPLNPGQDPPAAAEKVVKFRDGDVLLILSPGVVECSFVPDHEETQQLRNVVREELIESWGENLSTFIDRLKSRIGEVECKVGPFGLQGLARAAASAALGGVKALMPLLDESLKKHLRGQPPARDLTVFGIEK